MSDLSKIATQIAKDVVARASGSGSEIWAQIEQSAKFHIRAYSTLLVEVAAGVEAGEITKQDAKIMIDDARSLLFQGIAHTSTVILVEIQRFLNGIFKALKDAINARLPVPLL
jgi:hypothetical protein